MSLSVACADGATGEIEIRERDANGTLLGKCRITPTGGWDHFKPMKCKLKNPAGKLDVCLVFKGSAKEFCRLDWFSIK